MDGREQEENMNHQDFMKRTLEIARDKMNSNEGGPFGALIVRKGEIIAEGWNRVTSTCDPTAHAEVQAVRNACQKLGTFHLKDCVIYSSCEPCPMCLSAIYWAHIDRIYYACTKEDAAAIDFDDDLIYQEIKKPLQERIVPAENMMRERGLDVFKAWTEKEDRIPY